MELGLTKRSILCLSKYSTSVNTLMALTRPILGVVPPPRPRFAHISSRFAPPSRALFVNVDSVN